MLKEVTIDNKRSECLVLIKCVFDSGWDRERVVWRFEGDTSPNYDFMKHRRWAQRV